MIVREDLLDLMIDTTAAEYDLGTPGGDRLADLVEVGVQARAIMHRHPWLPMALTTRNPLGPRGADLLEHVLTVLAEHPADDTTKLEAFALLNAIVASLVRNEQSAAPSGEQQREAGYLQHLAAARRHPHIAALRPAPRDEDPQEHFRGLLGRVLTGLLPEEPASERCESVHGRKAADEP